MLSFQHQAPSANVGQNQAQQQQQQQNDNLQQQHQPPQPTQQQQVQSAQPQQQPQVQQTMRLRDDPPPITPPTRSGRKRKTPPTAAEQVQSQAQPPPPPPPQQPMQHVLPPPHALMHPLQGSLPPGYAYAAPTDYTPGGLPPGAIPGHPNMAQQPQPQPPPPQTASTGRTLSNSKRAEQNRKAQRAFRERRDQHVKALESRSQLLDAALASADEANRRWEECRALVDQLRIENATLRAALGAQHQMIPPSNLPPVTPTLGANGAAGNGTIPAPTTEDEKKPEGATQQGKESEGGSGGKNE